MTAITERFVIKNELRLFYNLEEKTWEVFATLLGSGGKRKWIKISDEMKLWYVNNFNPPVLTEKPTI